LQKGLAHRRFVVYNEVRGTRRRRVLHKIRVYVDTSVFGGTQDEEFAEASKAFFDGVANGKFVLLISEETIRELFDAPEAVRAFWESLSTDVLERVTIDDEVKELADKYLQAGVLGPASASDALHVATASVAGADLILSWNFRHIVNFSRIKGFNGVNVMNGYQVMTILSPLEVANDDQDKEF
jgi:predicted nucleic acid-binding protein